jgi:hypothetical protein
MRARFDIPRLILFARTRGGWAAERPQLTTEQFDSVRAIVGDRLSSRFLPDFRWHVGQIYTHAVENSLLLLDLRTEACKALGMNGNVPKLETLLERQIRVLQTAEASGREFAIPVTDGLRRMLIAHEFATQDLPGPADAARRIDDLVNAGWYTPARLIEIFEQMMPITKPGRDWFATRQMVCSLAALSHDITGKLPGRFYRSRDRNPEDHGEKSWFHALCDEMARYVFDALPVDARPKQRPTCQRLVNEELKKLAAEFNAGGVPKPRFVSQFPAPN